MKVQDMNQVVEQNLGGIRNELEAILNRAENLSFESRDILIWGTNAVVDRNKKFIEKLKPAFFVDNNEAIWGTKKWGIDIIAPDEISKLCVAPVVLISTMLYRIEIAKQLMNMNLEYYTLDEIIWGQHREDILEVYDLLETSSSKELFFQIILARIESQEIPEKYISENQYFARKEFRMQNSKENFIDLGAYVGDTIEKYIYK